MHGINLLRHAIAHRAPRVLDVGVGPGTHARAFLGAGSHVTGVDIQPSPFEWDDMCEAKMLPNYTHVHQAVELLEHEEGAEPFDLIWSCHVLEHIPNVQNHLVQLHDYLKDDGWLYIAVPTNSQDRLHVGHLTIWTPALLIYNLICAGWDCSDAKWYTSYATIGLCMQHKPIKDMSWRTAMPGEEVDMNEYTPIPLRHEHGAWVANNWHEELPGRVSDPPFATAGLYQTDIPPKVQLAFGPNPKLREGYEKENR